MIIDFEYFSNVLYDNIIVESDVFIKEPNSSDTNSDLDCKGYIDIMSLECYYAETNEVVKVQSALFDEEVYQKIKEQIRFIEIENMMYSNNLSEQEEQMMYDEYRYFMSDKE